MNVLYDFSPNFSKTLRLKRDIKFVIIHYTGMQSEIASSKRLKNPNSKVSCHYLINRQGIVIQMDVNQLQEAEEQEAVNEGDQEAYDFTGYMGNDEDGAYYEEDRDDEFNED